MPRQPNVTPIEAFNYNMGDAFHLIQIAQSFTNQRQRRARAELRRRAGDLLTIPARDHGEIDCVESDHVFVVIKPGAPLERDHFNHHEPMLRQAIVAGCAALETYLVDAAVARVRLVLRSGAELPARLKNIPMRLEQWQEVGKYTYLNAGVTELVLKPYIKEFASTAASKVGELLSTVGVDKGLSRIDRQRGVDLGVTLQDLERITIRRNRIAHQGDRPESGRKNAREAIDVKTVRDELSKIQSIAKALDLIFKP